MWMMRAIDNIRYPDLKSRFFDVPGMVLVASMRELNSTPKLKESLMEHSPRLGQCFFSRSQGDDDDEREDKTESLSQRPRQGQSQAPVAWVPKAGTAALGCAVARGVLTQRQAVETK